MLSLIKRGVKYTLNLYDLIAMVLAIISCLYLSFALSCDKESMKQKFHIVISFGILALAVWTCMLGQPTTI